MAIRNRTSELDFIKIDNTIEAMTDLFTNLTESMSPQERTKQYVNQKSKTKTVTSIEREFKFEGDQVIGNKVAEFFEELGKEGKVGGECETEYYRVDSDKPSNTEGGFYARKFKVTVKIEEFPNNDNELGFTGSLMCMGDPVVGTFNASDKSFTEGFTPKTT